MEARTLRVAQMAKTNVVNCTAFPRICSGAELLTSVQGPDEPTLGEQPE